MNVAAVLALHGGVPVVAREAHRRWPIVTDDERASVSRVLDRGVLSGMFAPDKGFITVAGRSVTGLAPEDITRAGVGRSFQIANLFGGLTAEENMRLAVQARSARRFAWWASAQDLSDINAETAAFGDVVILAVPFAAIDCALTDAGSVRGRVLWSCVNALRPDYTGLAPQFLRADTVGSVHVPTGSTLLAQVHGAGALPRR